MNAYSWLTVPRSVVLLLICYNVVIMLNSATEEEQP